MVYHDKKVTVIMAAYNEEAVIGAVLAELSKIDVIDEIIVIDDGSADNTAQIVAEFPPPVMLVRHPHNIGQSAAIKTGTRLAGGDLIIWMDSDGQHPPSEVYNLLQYSDDYQMVVGARSHESDTSWFRNLGNSVFKRYATYIVGTEVEDLTSGLRLIRADIAKKLVYLLPNGFSSSTTMTIAVFRFGYAVKYYPFASPARVGVSKIKPIRDGLRFMLRLTRLGTLFVPMKIFLPVSILFILVGGGYVAFILLTLGNFSGFGGMLFTVGVLVFMLGLIAEQIALLLYSNSDR